MFCTNLFRRTRLQAGLSLLFSSGLSLIFLLLLQTILRITLLGLLLDYRPLRLNMTQSLRFCGESRLLGGNVSLRRFGSQSRLFDCQTLSLCHRSKSCLFTGQNSRLLSACSFGNLSLALLFSGNPLAFRCQSLRLCGSCLCPVVGLNRGQPVLHVDLLLVEHLD